MAKRKFLSYFDVGQKSTDWVFGNLAYLFFLGFLAIVYIANSHLAERNVREIQRLQKEIKELKWEYTSIKSETMYKSLQSQLDPSVESSGLQLDPQGPKVIVVEE